jgi:rfaE bifunctional protein kinase chain/domain/rfaE bifunctional protein nucleotidyltransferase chain/domain
MSMPGRSGGKIVDRAELLKLRASARARGDAVVLCHGCFDIVHPGHLRHLQQARALGRVLVVSITGDAHVGKGAGRPLIPQELRAENLAALDIVDHVHIAPEPTALELLRELRPDVYIKGREYETNGDPRFRAEREAVESAGGRVVFSSGDVVFSSTALIRSLEQAVDPSHTRLAQLLGSPELGAEALGSIIEGFRGRPVTVVGEVILDTYVICDRPDVAGESPVLTLRPLETRRYDGGAAVIARHAAALGAAATLVTALPPGEESDELIARLRGEGVQVLWVPARGMMLAEKQRYVVGAQKVVKIDLVRPAVLDAGEREALAGLVASARRPQAGIVADFGLGVLTGPTTRAVIGELRKQGAFIAGDVSGRRADLRAMAGAHLVTPSESELRDAMHLYDEALPAVLSRFMHETGVRRAIVTMGAEGAVAFEPMQDRATNDAYATSLKAEHLPSLAPVAIDALGCGDALLTAATLALSGGATMPQAAFLGSAAAAVQARRFGNSPVSATDLRRTVAGLHAANLAFAPADEIAAGSRRAS